MAGMPEQRIETAPEPFHLKAFLGSLWISPRKHPDFAWVWITRFLMTMGIWTIEPFLQYYLGDVIGAQHPAETAGKLMGAILAGATVTGLIGGRISDRVGRKPVVYVANSIAAGAAIGLIFAHTLQSALIIGMVFGFGYGAYYSVDWALGCDVLPRREDAAKDLGVWHVAMTLPQTLAAPVAGNLLAAFGQRMVMGPNGPVAHYLLPGYMAIFSLAALLLVLAAVLLRQVKGVR
jgi:MFS family permease